MKIQKALVSNILNRSQRYFAHITTVTLSWRVQNIVVIGRVYFTLECFEFSSNFEFDRNMLSGTGARGSVVVGRRNNITVVSISAGSRVINFRMTVNGHETCLFLKGNTTWCVRSLCWIVLYRWIERTKSWHSLSPSWGTAYWAQILLACNIPQKPHSSAVHINLSFRVRRFKFLHMSKNVMATLGFGSSLCPFPSFYTLKTRLNDSDVQHSVWEAEFKMNNSDNIQILIQWTAIFKRAR